MRIYLDACCLSRLTDDPWQPRIRAEAESIEQILRLVREGLATWVSSLVLVIEVGRNPSADRRRDAESLLLFAREVIIPQSAESRRAGKLQELGFDPFDALHLACAERGGADVFLTTDDALLRRARRNASRVHIRVENPVLWYEEVRV